MRGMQIVLPGALPEAAFAHELASHIERSSPQFASWLADGHAHTISAVPTDTYCTPYEYWLLRRHGFEAGAGERPSAGLAAVYARDAGVPTQADQPLWLAQLVHVAPARDGAALIPASELEISPDQSAALFSAAAEYFPDSGFSINSFDTMHWRVGMPADYCPATASPALVSITSVNDWWTQDNAGRPWRRLVNELQMLWFDHPVNRDRESRGLRPINSVWLYGGAPPSRLKLQTQSSGKELRVLRHLQGPALVQDWGSWLQQLELLEREEFSRISTMPELVLTGSDRIVELSPAHRGFLSRLLGRKHDWRRWWSVRN